MKKVLLFTLIISISSFSKERLPFPKERDDLWQKICEYKSLSESTPEVGLESFIVIFENMFNTNQIVDSMMKKEVFCLLRDYYKKEDPDFEKEFVALIPSETCRQNKR